MFGCSVAGTGAPGRDKRGGLAIGSNAGNKGAVHIFHGTEPSLVIYGKTEKGKFGITLSQAGDVNGDGRSDLLAGEPWNNEKAERAGAIHLFY
ncbi:MAG: FG-GAP repeat protein [Thermodesulfovibrionales bacterium]|jgi:hypothetical protein